MEPLNDDELDELLMKWRAPSAPQSLDQRVRSARRGSWWKWLMTGSIRVPVPLTLAFIFALLAMFAVSIARAPATEKTTGVFQPVKRLEPRIIRSIYENSR